MKGNVVASDNKTTGKQVLVHPFYHLRLRHYLARDDSVAITDTGLPLGLLVQAWSL